MAHRAAGHGTCGRTTRCGEPWRRADLIGRHGRMLADAERQTVRIWLWVRTTCTLGKASFPCGGSQPARAPNKPRHTVDHRTGSACLLEPPPRSTKPNCPKRLRCEKRPPNRMALAPAVQSRLLCVRPKVNSGAWKVAQLCVCVCACVGVSMTRPAIRGSVGRCTENVLGGRGRGRWKDALYRASFRPLPIELQCL